MISEASRSHLRGSGKAQQGLRRAPDCPLLHGHEVERGTFSDGAAAAGAAPGEAGRARRSGEHRAFMRTDMQHDWIKSTLGHGNQMCRRCFVTDLEAAAIGMVECDPPPPKAANQNAPARQVTRDEIDDAMLSDDEGEEYDESEECGRWNNGALSKQCSLAGTEWCDWCCPIGLRGQ